MKLRIKLEGKTYDVDVEVIDEAPPAEPPPARSVKPPAPPPVPFSRTRRGKDEKNARSPLAGVVVSILVAPGQRVEKGQPLAILEAMKMESRILSPSAGAVKSIPVSVGEAVKPGQVLVELE